MLILGIESSCDETSAAVVEDGRRILSNVVASQVDLHRSFGGVVPELAARSHLELLPHVVDRALADASVRTGDIERVAVTRGPGLVGSLLVGVSFAQALAFERDLPVVGVSHLEGHIHSAYLESPGLETPMLVLVVSGGHTEMVEVHNDGRRRLLGRTLDDAAGEAFDKGARLLGLDYPGGPEIERVARGVNRSEANRRFPLPRIRVDALNFSFSGIKTALRYALERGPAPGADVVAAAAASLQYRITEHLLDRLVAAAGSGTFRTVVVAGGVARNGPLRLAVEEAFAVRPEQLVVPRAELCTDNAAMIAAAAFFAPPRGSVPADIEVDPALQLA